MERHHLQGTTPLLWRKLIPVWIFSVIEGGKLGSHQSLIQTTAVLLSCISFRGPGGAQDARTCKGLERGDDNLTFDCKQQAISLVPNPELSWRKSKMRCPKSQNWFCIDKWRIKCLIGTVNVFKAIGWEAWQFWAEIPFSTGNFYRIHCNEFTATVIITTKQIGFPY